MKKIIIISSFAFVSQLCFSQQTRNTVTFAHGDLVISGTGRIFDGQLEKCNEAYSELVVGVYNETTALLNVPSILETGIAYIKFDDANGHVVAGDYITGSSKTGYGMKAKRSGVMVGVALEDSPGKQSGLLKIRVQVGWEQL